MSWAQGNLCGNTQQVSKDERREKKCDFKELHLKADSVNEALTWQEILKELNHQRMVQESLLQPCTHKRPGHWSTQAKLQKQMCIWILSQQCSKVPAAWAVRALLPLPVDPGWSLHTAFPPLLLLCPQVLDDPKPCPGKLLLRESDSLGTTFLSTSVFVMSK